MNVLDPFEVAEIEVWPLWNLGKVKGKRKADLQTLDAAEYTVFERVLRSSSFKAVLNEKEVRRTDKTTLPSSYRGRIIPDELWESRKHPDVRIARRTATIASLARVISERQVQPGLRRTLLTQARRLEKLARDRFNDFRNDVPTKGPSEEE